MLAAVGKPDADAHTRGQQKKIDEIQAEPPAKKPRLSKETTMAGTAKVCVSLSFSFSSSFSLPLPPFSFQKRNIRDANLDDPEDK